MMVVYIFFIDSLKSSFEVSWDTLCKKKKSQVIPYESRLKICMYTHAPFPARYPKQAYRTFRHGDRLSGFIHTYV